MVCEQVLEVKLAEIRVGVGCAAPGGWYPGNKHPEALRIDSWKKRHWHTVGRPELDRGEEVQGGETGFPEDGTTVPLLTV